MAKKCTFQINRVQSLSHLIAAQPFLKLQLDLIWEEEKVWFCVRVVFAVTTWNGERRTKRLFRNVFVRKISSDVCKLWSVCYNRGFFGWRGVSLLTLRCGIVGTGLCWLWVELQFSCPEINLTVRGKKVSFLM